MVDNLRRFGTAGLYVTTNGDLLVTLLVVFAVSATSLVIRLADMTDSLISLFFYPRSRRILWRSLALFSKVFFLTNAA